LRRLLAAVALLALSACGVITRRPPAAALPADTPAAPPSPAPTPTPIIPRRSEIVIAAWTEPRYLPQGGGPVQILVRVRRVGGGPYPGVQVQVQTSAGSLFSAGRPLVTDVQGMCRDRLTTNRPANVVVQIGDTRYRLKVTPLPES
jgi:hypothetical protein